MSFCRSDVFLRRSIQEGKWTSIQEGKWAKVGVRNPKGTVGKDVKIMDEDLGGRETTEEENGITCGSSAKTSGHQCKARQETIFAFGKRFPSRQVQAFPNYLSSAAAGPPPNL